MSKLTATQKREIAATVKAAKQSDGRVTWSTLYATEAAAWHHDGDITVATAVLDQLREWSSTWERAYSQLSTDIQRVTDTLRRPDGSSVYLFDENIDQENVCVYGRTEQSVDYWWCMVSAAGPMIGERADQEGIDINALLGRPIY